MPLISIITVTFNAEKELPDTLRSVEQQTFTDYEHIIVDGASKDSTLDIARCSKNPRIKIFSKPDKGIYHGMNRGLKYARGEYVIFLNAGDKFASPDTLLAFAEIAEKGFDIIYGDTVIVDENGNILRKRHFDAPDILTVDSYKKGMLVCHQAFMAKKSIAPEYSRKYRFSADYEWCLNCMKNTQPQNCANLNQVVIHYLDNGTTEKNKIASLKERYRIMSATYGPLTTLFIHLRKLLRL